MCVHICSKFCLTHASFVDICPEDYRLRSEPSSRATRSIGIVGVGFSDRPDGTDRTPQHSRFEKILVHENIISFHAGDIDCRRGKAHLLMDVSVM